MLTPGVIPALSDATTMVAERSIVVTEPTMIASTSAPKPIAQPPARRCHKRAGTAEKLSVLQEKDFLNA